MISKMLKEGIVLGDGGTLFELERRGYVSAGPFTPEVVIQHPDVVRQLHSDYARAGSNVLQAFTYYAHVEKLKVIGMEGSLKEINSTATRLAREVADEYGCLVAGNLANTWVYDPKDPSSHKETRRQFDEQIEHQLPAGTDFFIAETIQYLGEAKLALEAIKAADRPCMITLGFKFQDKTLDGVGLEDAFKELSDLGADIVGINCFRDPKAMLPLAARLRKAVTGYIATQPVAFRCSWEKPFFQIQEFDGRIAFPLELDPFVLSRLEMADYALEARDIGVNYIGACCGTSPHHIRAMAESLGRTAPNSKYSPKLQLHPILGEEEHIRETDLRILSGQRGEIPLTPAKEITVSHNLKQIEQRKSLSDENYLDAVAQGHYILHQGGITGKHDNVRRLWEDQIRGFIIRPHLLALLDELRAEGKGLRVADLGAGTGQGFEILRAWIGDEMELPYDQTNIIPFDYLESYSGCDLSKAMVDQGNSCYSDQPNVSFSEGDLSCGFPLKEEKPFHLYFSSYSSLSHISSQEMEQLLTEITEHADGTALVVGDWLGRSSIEWPCYWNESGAQMLDYSMKWLDPSKKPDAPVRHFPMQFWMPREIREMTERVARKTKTHIDILELRDVSILVGRHSDTGLYNKTISPLRSIINRLHESNLRTDLTQLRANVQPLPQNQEIRDFFETLQNYWNKLVEYCEIRLKSKCDPSQIEGWNLFPPVVQKGMIAIDLAVNAAADLQMDDPRANAIEPQLGYTLRDLEIGLQRGLGVAHALLVIFKINKS